MINLLYTDKNGELYESDLNLAISQGSDVRRATKFDIISMPSGATITALPGRTPLGVNKNGEIEKLSIKSSKNNPIWAVGALLPQGFTRTHLPSYTKCGDPDVLPLLGYTALGSYNGKLVICAKKTDEHRMWNPKYYNTDDLRKRVMKVEKLFPDNEIIRQLGHCALEYGCFTAQNIFYNRYEGGLPISPSCNARCLGCISEQESECCPSPQGRIKYQPKLKDVVEVAAFHLRKEDNIISFGQGCEGEPSLSADIASKAIIAIRKRSKMGTINMNTNGGYTKGIMKLTDSGIDTLRISLISANEDRYNSYYRPKNYSIDDVLESAKYAVKNGVYVSLNLLTLPGFNDREDEIEYLLDFIAKTRIQKVQLRNLNIDPEFFYKTMGIKESFSCGIDYLIDSLHNIEVEVGNYSRPKL